MIIQGIGFLGMLMLAASADSFVDMFGFIPYALAIAVTGAAILLPDKLR